jgi:glycerol kinase
VYSGIDDISALWQIERRFEPSISAAAAAELMQRWEHAVRQATAA